MPALHLRTSKKRNQRMKAVKRKGGMRRRSMRRMKDARSVILVILKTGGNTEETRKREGDMTLTEHASGAYKLFLIEYS